MPDPKKGESKKDYMKRCVPHLKGEGKDQDQAVAVCLSMWDRRNEGIRGAITSHMSFEEATKRANENWRRNLMSLETGK